MAFTLANLKRGVSLSPPTLLIYGPHGLGKTTLAAGAPNSILMQLEDGRGMLDTPTFGLLSTYAEVDEAINFLGTGEHDFKNLIVDTVDWLEPIVQAETCRRNGWSTIEEPSYGVGYTATIEDWKYLLAGFNGLRNHLGMSIIFLAHAAVTNFKSPEVQPYDRYGPKLHVSAKGIGANALLQEHVDAILFYNWRTSVVTDKTSNNKKDVGHNRGVGGGQRIIYTQERPASIAKNRYGMPPEIVIPNDAASAWPTLAAHIPYFNQAA